MHCIVRCIGMLMMSFALVVPGLPAPQDKKQDAPKKDAKGKTKIDWTFDFTGKLTDLSENDDKGTTFTVHVTYKYPELNTDAQQQIAQHQQTMVQQQMQLQRAKNAQDQRNALSQMANTQRQLEQSMAQLYKYKDVNFDVKCRAADKLRVRRFEPALPVDSDTGEFLKMTKQMLEEAKGKEGYPGYKADSKTLANNQMVRVYVWKDSKTPANFLDKSQQAKMKADDVQAALKNFRFDVIMIYVATDAPKTTNKN